ncbi:MAG: DUF386 domain-containing protein [Spirochaetae bacterium HGW-Spirochaetae-9]|nr:MAG: DUF386 domain-containing protein [Spirochaetae bacterium HGW-Spirochaetae-9]
MIIANIQDLGRYRGLNKNLDTAFAWLQAGGWEKLPVGRQEIDGDKVYALVQEYDSKMAATCRFETHRVYTDIQLLVSGREIVEARAAKGLEAAEAYRPDIEYYSTPSGLPAHSILLEAGIAAVFFPEDAHRPCMAIGGKPEHIRKIVMKVAMEKA